MSDMTDKEIISTFNLVGVKPASQRQEK